MNFNIVEVVLAIAVALALFQGLGRLSRRIRKLPPGPFPLPIIGNLHLFFGDQQPHKTLAKISQIHGPIMSIQFGQLTTVVISSPAMAKEVLQKHDSAFSSRSVPNAVHAIDHHRYSVGWIPVGTRWRVLRKTMNTNLFSSSRLDANHHLRASKIQELIAYCNKRGQSGEAVDIGFAAFRTTLNLLSNTIFSKDSTDPLMNSVQELKESIEGIMVEVGKPNLVDFFPWLEKIDPQGIRRRSNVYYSKLLELCGRLIDERLEKKKLQDGTQYHDMLEALLTTSDEDLTRTLIEHLLVDLFIAGTDTTANTVEWAITELLKNSMTMKRIQDELSNVIGRGKPVEEADIARLPYLSCVVRETFRLHPAGPLLLPRSAVQDAKVCGYTVPKGSRVLVNVWAIGRDPTVWEDPLSFRPERFWESEIDVQGCNFELIPFGAGRRVCPGVSLANRMIPIMVGSLLNSFDWKLESGLTSEQLDTEERFGITIQRTSPLRAIPIPI